MFIKEQIMSVRADFRFRLVVIGSVLTLWGIAKFATKFRYPTSIVSYLDLIMVACYLGLVIYGCVLVAYLLSEAQSRCLAVVVGVLASLILLTPTTSTLLAENSQRAVDLLFGSIEIAGRSALSYQLSWSESVLIWSHLGLIFLAIELASWTIYKFIDAKVVVGLK